MFCVRVTLGKIEFYVKVKLSNEEIASKKLKLLSFKNIFYAVFKFLKD